VSVRELRVLHLLGELRPSGAETMLAAAGPAFAARGIRSDILGTGAVPGPFADRLADAGYGVRHLAFARSPEFFLRLARSLRGYDVLHLHTERASFWIALTAWLAGIRLTVRTIHSAFAFEGGLRRRRLLQRRLLAHLGVHFVAVSRSVQEVERRHFGLRVGLIPNWFDEARFQPAGEGARSEARRALGIPDAATVVVSVGNCSQVKNHGELLRALAILPAASRPLYLHVGAEEPGAPERRLAAELGVAGQVRFLGTLPNVDLALRAADGFVMPSLVEGLGISALEALACGLPSILADVAGLRDLATGFPGVRRAAPQATALAAALADFLDEAPDARRRATAAWPELAKLHHGLESGVDAYVRLYRGGSLT